MTERAVRRATALLGRRYGLRIDGSTRRRLTRLLTEGAALAGCDTDHYAAALAGDDAELQAVVDRLTVQKTAFFRHPAHFDVVRAHLLTAPGGVIWSAGCADGQEAWSLAMLLGELGLPGWSVLATDVSARAVARARDGVYAERALDGLDARRRERWLRPAGDGRWEIAPALRARVRFAHHNLVREPPPADVDGRVVLCRNVLIYLRPADAGRLLARLRARMPADGLLLLGAAEALPPDHPDFAVERLDGVFTYRPRRSRPARDPPAPLGPAAPEMALKPPGRPAPEPLPPTAELLAAGERLASEGRHREAAASFRKAAYLSPEDPLAHARLGFALEAAGHAHAARRAFRAARAALTRARPEALEGQLDGWSLAELERLIADRSAAR